MLKYKILLYIMSNYICKDIWSIILQYTEEPKTIVKKVVPELKRPILYYT